MCVIVYKPKGVDCPDIETIKKCWNRNPDGAGMMWIDEKEKNVKFIKGYMHLKNFLADYIPVMKDFKNVELALHFRIKTNGTVSSKNCHPFPVTTDEGMIHDLSGESESVLMHNGILSIDVRKGDFSDSAELAMLAGEYDSSIQYLNNVNPFLRDSKVLLFSYEGGTPSVNMYGDSFIKSGDLYFSNLYHVNKPIYSGWDKYYGSYYDKYNEDEYDERQSVFKDEAEGGEKEQTWCDYYDSQYADEVLKDPDNIADFEGLKKVYGESIMGNVERWVNEYLPVWKLCNIIDDAGDSGLPFWSYVFTQYPDSQSYK